VFRGVVVGAFIAALPLGATAHASADTSVVPTAYSGGAPTSPLPFIGCGAGTYQNSSGNCVPDPTQPDPSQPQSPPPGATAKCRDGGWSFSQHRSGTCSGHGGVAQWLTS
jgi:Protein of unknown function (DUF3761)